MKKSLLFMLLTLMGHSMMAKPVEPEKAMQVAKNFVAQYVKGTDQMEATVVYTHKMPKSGQPAMYVVNLGSTFVIVSADDVAHPVLGYSLSRPWPTLGTQTSSSAKEQGNVALPSQVTAYLDDLAAQIEAAILGPQTSSSAPSEENATSALGPQTSSSASNEETSAEWHQLLSLNSHLLTTTNLPDSVGPLLTTTWDQGQYYNALCPEDPDGLAGHVPTGCVATAMAQIINYWGYPVHGRGIHSYNHSTYGTISVNYDSATYDYAHMPNALTATSTPQEVNAVATLIRDCGVAANMAYGSTESSTYDVDARAGLINFFRLNPNLSYAEKSSFLDSVWMDMLRTDIAANRPVMYSGHGDDGGHTFVCDGFKQNGYFHFNFGWSGYADGWYLTNVVNPAGMAFNSDQSALLGIVPDSTGNVILGQMSGTSTFTVDETLMFYHLLGHNAYHGMDFSQSFESTTNFIAHDTLIPIVANLLNYSGDQSARVYYGNENDYHMIYPVMNWFPILESFDGTFRIEYSGNWHYAGFCLQISKRDTCGILSYFDISSTVDTNQVVLSWLNRDSVSEWIIEYGEEGFNHGNGTVLSSNTNNITINNLLPYTYYDIFIKPVCSDSWTGPISVKTELSYWQDYVSEQPEGIVYDVEGYALVSTPEQLAWLVRENSNCEKISIVADLDMSGHRWKPVDTYSNYQGKIIDGNNHHISNLLIREDKNSMFNYIGFFGCLFPAYSIVIRDMVFDNPNIIAERSVTRCGVLAGEIRPVFSGEFTYTVVNCGVNGGNINCSAFSAGGLVGGFEGDLLNSYANINILNSYRNPHTGGLVADFYGGRIINCYSASEIEYTPFSCSEGQIIGSIEAGQLRNVYGKNSPYALFYSQYGNAMDTSSFGDDNILFTGIIYDDSVYYDLCTVLNKHVQSRNDSTWRTWQYDSIQGYPVLNDPYHVTCSNVSDLMASNVMHEGQCALRIDWSEDSAYSYIVKCVNLSDSTDSVQLYNIDTNICFINDLHLMDMYEIYVKCNCDSSQSGWGEPVIIIFDRPYWTDIVTSQPTGYFEDTDGNVTISSAEGLAWFACRVNGLNGNESFNFRNKNVSLISDVDLGQYKWMPIGFSQVDLFNVPDVFQGVFNGNGHIISNLYVNEEADYVGLFGKLFQAKVINVTIEDSYVKGLKRVGGLCGIYLNSDIFWSEFNYGNTIFDNCHIIQSNVHGKNEVGGLCGLLQSDINDATICNCSSSGNVSGITEFGGLIGFIAQNSNKKIENCFSSSNVFCNESNDYGNGYYGGLIGYAFNASITNCYTAGIVDTLIIGGYTGSMIGVLDNSHLNYMYGILDTIYNPYTPWGVYSVYNTTMFSLNANLYMLQNPITIENTTYTDLLSALNAWVDTYDTAGIYRHWAADSANVNGGYPVFAAIATPPCTPATNSDSITVCDSYTWHGTVYTTDATLLDTLSTLDGCDSIVTHYLIIKHSTSDTETTTACESYFFGGQWLYASGQYTDTLTNAAGCDSIATLYLTINNPIHTTTTVTACDSYTWNGATITTSGDYTYPHNDDYGCTQVDTLHLTINYSTASSETATACEAYFWDGEWRYISGQYSDTNTNIVGCDSIVTLNLTINNPVHTATTVTACDSYTWQEAVITTSGTYHYTHTDAHGCTQDDTLYLTINHNDTVIVDEEVCDSLTWYGTTYTASAYGVQYLTVPNTVGCDSVFFLDLTVNYTTYGEMSAVSCDSYEWDWNGAVYTASGDYTYRDTVNMNSQFCDSVLTLHLTINHSATSDTTATACDLFVWYGLMGYDVSGDYEHRWWNVTADGCDSILTLHLTINHSAETTVTDTAEGSYTWNGTTYTESGTYTWTGETVEGCDSSVTLILTINQVGIFDIQNSEFKINIFPNPTTDLLTIDADDILSVELFDLNGRRIFSSEVDSSPFTVHLSPFTLSAGSYLLRIHTRQGTAVQHVILK